MGFVRVISGRFGGRRLEVPAGAHPMGEREKGALFNSLSGDVSGAQVLDAFAGSGALGLEALSRGAESAVFVENSRKGAETIEKNIKELGADGTKVYRMGVDGFTELGEKFDIIFADPPYNKPQYNTVAKLAKLLNDGGLFALSQPMKDDALEMDGLELLSSKTYAGARISIYRNMLK